MDIDGNINMNNNIENTNHDKYKNSINNKFKIVLLCSMKIMFNGFVTNTKIPIFFIKSPDLFGILKKYLNIEIDVLNSHELIIFYNNFIKCILNNIINDEYYKSEVNIIFENLNKKLDDEFEKCIGVIKKKNQVNLCENEKRLMFNEHVYYTINYIKILENQIELLLYIVNNDINDNNNNNIDIDNDKFNNINIFNIKYEFNYINIDNILLPNNVKSNYFQYYNINYIAVLNYYFILLKIDNKHKNDQLNDKIYLLSGDNEVFKKNEDMKIEKYYESFCNKNYVEFFIKINYDENMKIDHDNINNNKQK